MEATRRTTTTSVTIMTLHGAKGLEFDTVFLPGWEEGLFPHQRSLDENGRAGLEEERRLAYVGITRARRRAKIYFATNRRILQACGKRRLPSRFLDELPAIMSRSLRRRQGRPMAAMRNRASPTCDSFALVLRNARLAARATPQRRGEAKHQGQGGASPGGFRQSGRGADRCRSRANSSRSRAPELAVRQGARVFHHEVRLWRGRRHRRQQAHRRFRQGGPEDGAGELCAARRLSRENGMIDRAQTPCPSFMVLSQKQFPFAGHLRLAPSRLRKSVPSYAVAVASIASGVLRW